MKKEEILTCRFDSKKELLISKKDLISNLAKCAIECSPYLYPDNLLEVIEQFHSNIEPYFKFLEPSDLGFLKLDLTELEKFIRGNLMSIPEFLLWNERKNGRDGYGFVSRYSGETNPDDDFIDLDALIRNISHEIFDSQIQY